MPPLMIGVDLSLRQQIGSAICFVLAVTAPPLDVTDGEAVDHHITR
jgi:hypothetical protein